MPPEKPKPPPEKAIDRVGRVDVGFGSADGPPYRTPPDDDDDDDDGGRVTVTVGAPSKDMQAAMQEEAEQDFADEVASFFAELQMAQTANEEAKKQLIDQLTILIALFQTSDATNFTTPMNKLAALKTRVHAVAPELVGDFVLMMQAGLRAWLGRV